MNYVQIGKIVNTHGLKGEVKVLADTDFKMERYLSKHPVFIKSGDVYERFFVKTYRIHKGFDLLTLAGLEDINLVEKYKGKFLFAEDLPVEDLDENEFRKSDLVGMTVIQSGIEKGRITDIRSLLQGDYLVVEGSAGTSLVPFRDEFVTKVDLANRQVMIVDMEGLL